MTMLLLVPAFLLLSASSTMSEMILRGQCSRFFHPQEVAITVDLSDVALNLYVIQPVNISSSQENCMAKCLAATNPPCRSLIYQPDGKTCILLRAEKSIALTFDTREAAQPIYGILVAPQALTDLVTDRINGVPNCASFCPDSAVQTADTVTPVCVADCPNSSPICAGEEAGCFDYPRRFLYGHSNAKIQLFSSTANNFFSFTNWQKKHSFTNIRIFFSIPYYQGNGGSVSTWDYQWITVNVGGYQCQGEKGLPQMVGKSYPFQSPVFNIGEQMSGEILCTSYDIPSGSYTIGLNNIRSGALKFYNDFAVVIGAQSTFYLHAEEYIPARYNFKLDDSARCQAATVFNTVSDQFTDGYTTTGLTPFRILKYKKRSDSSTLRIYWHGKVYQDANSHCLHFYFTINDQLCSNPYSIENSLYYDGLGLASSSRIDVSSKTINIDGVCKGLSAGRYDIALWANTNCPSITHSNNVNAFNIGHGYNSLMFVEEINENLPMNSLLLSDGSLVQLPYYNRQYFVWNTFCTNSGGCASSCDTTLPCVSAPFQTFTYQKLQASSKLHVKWYAGHMFCYSSTFVGGTTEAFRWYIRINGQECSNPYKIESWWLDWANSYKFCAIVPKYVEGVCAMSIPAGPTTISFQIGFVPGSSTMRHASAAGRGGTSYLMVEELNSSA